MAKKKPSFSVLMSVYKKEEPQNLAKSLDSILNQTIKPDEIVLVEDGKLGIKLENVVKKYEKENTNLRVIRFKTNRGLGIALRDGVLKCKNEIIFRMDTDDISQKNRFEKQLDALSKTKADVVGSNIEEYDASMTRKTGERIVPELNEDILKVIKTRNPFNHMTVVFKKQKVLAAGNYDQMNGFEDYYLWLRMAKMGAAFYNIQENLVKVRCGREMYERRGGAKYVRNIIRFQKALLESGIVSRRQYLINIAIRTVVSCSPNWIRAKIYNNLLRKGEITK